MNNLGLNNIPIPQDLSVFVVQDLYLYLYISLCGCFLLSVAAITRPNRSYNFAKVCSSSAQII